jgi:8-amino-7-oxononanoate synthase
MSARRDPLGFLEVELEGLARVGLLRTPRAPAGDKIALCSNDYLGFAGERWGTTTASAGAGASRLVSGQTDAHVAAERAAAAWVGLDTALLFSSGYAANVGCLSALVAPGDLVVSDALNHASIIDGLRLARARVAVTPHLDLDAVERALAGDAPGGRRWVVVESLFSMDGDSPDLQALRALCDANGAALVVDEAHALGVWGPEGAGYCAASAVVPDVLIGTLGKAVGLQGAFVAGRAPLTAWLWNRARSFVFSTGVSPALAELATDRIRLVRAADDRRERLREVGRRLSGALASMGVEVPSAGPIFPWVLGSAGRAVQVSELLWERGVHVQAIRPPTVPDETSRLRITASAALTDDALEAATGALTEVAALSAE